MKKHLSFSIVLLGFLLISKDVTSQLNVGVGTASPSFRLDVQGDPITPGTVNLYSKVNYVGGLGVIAVEGYSKPGDGVGYGGRFTGGYRGIEGYAPGGANALACIGVYGNSTGSAGNRFGVYGDASGGTNNYGVYGFASGGAGYYAVYGSAPNALAYAGWFNGRGYFSDDLTLMDKVGIGTTAVPTTKLQIINGSDCSLTLNGFVQFGASNSWNLILDDNEILARDNGAGNDLLMQNDGGNVLMCSSKFGGVGIGIAAGDDLANGYLFSVDGKIIAEEMRIQNFLNWPDYVFSDHYDLMPLDQLKDSIQTNKHLPNIPSAEEIETDGILVGDMQKRLMEKIEELTLYIIDLNETNKRQQAEIDALKTVVSTSKISGKKKIDKAK